MRSRRLTALVVFAATAALAAAIALRPAAPPAPRPLETCGCAGPDQAQPLTPRVSAVPALVVR